MNLLSFALPIVLPMNPGGFNISLLARFRSSTKKNNPPITVAPEVNPVTWTKTNALLEDPRTDTLGVAQITLFHTIQRRRDFRRSESIKSLEPACKRARALKVDIF